MSGTFAFSAEDIEVFLAESEELMAALEECLLNLERSERAGQVPDPEVLAAAFRAAHTLKGSSGTVGLTSVARLTHAMENVLDLMRSGAAGAGSHVPILLQALDRLRAMMVRVVEAVGREGVEALSSLGQEEDPEANRLAALLTSDEPGVPPAAPEAGATVLDSPAKSPVVLPEAPVQRSGMPGELLRVAVEIHPECALPAVRAYQVVTALEQLGEITDSRPSMVDIESGNCGHHLEFTLETEAPPVSVEMSVAAVSDVRRVEVTAAADSAGDSHTAGADGGVGGIGAAGSPTAGASGAAGFAGAAGGAGAGGAGAAGQGAAMGGRSVRVDVRVLDELMNLAGELVIQRTRLGRLLEDLAAGGGQQGDDLSRTAEDVGRLASQLQEQVMKARMLPVRNLFRRFPRMVRDLAAGAGKEIDLVIRGEDTELDRAVMDEIGDPLVHILRNAVDHGIELPAEREAAGKPPQGRIELVAEHEENYVLITVRDDGRGIDLQRVGQKAVALGLVKPGHLEHLTEEEVMNFIFAPGFSTASRVSEVSGRGVGLDVVRRNVERLGGTLHVANHPGRGTEFALRMPLTLAIIRCLLCEWGEEIFAIPLSQVEEVVPVEAKSLAQVHQRKVMVVRQQAVPFLPLDKALHLADGEGLRPEFAVLVLAGRASGQDGQQRAALGVTGLLGDQEIVVKDLGSWLGNVRGLAGATILGDGRLALILDVPGLLRARMR